MINNPQVPGVQSAVEAHDKSQIGGSGVCARTAIAATLLVMALAIAVTSLAQSNRQATAKVEKSAQTSQATPTLSVPLDSGEVGPFAFGYLVFEDDPARGVPGFGTMPPGSSAR